MAKKLRNLVSDKTTQEALVIIGSTIKKLREEKGWTLEKCEELGYDNYRMWDRVENGKTNLTMLTLFKICTVLKVSPSEILKDVKLKF